MNNKVWFYYYIRIISVTSVEIPVHVFYTVCSIDSLVRSAYEKNTEVLFHYGSKT